MKRIAIEVKFISVEEKIKFLVSRSKYCYEFSQNFHFALFALCRRMEEKTLYVHTLERALNKMRREEKKT